MFSEKPDVPPGFRVLRSVVEKVDDNLHQTDSVGIDPQRLARHCTFKLMLTSLQVRSAGLHSLCQHNGQVDRFF